MKEINITESKEKTRKYTTVIVPVELAQKLSELSTKKGIAIWRLIHEAITFYETLEAKPKKKNELPELNKYSWYIYKLSKSVSLFLENPSRNNYVKLRRRLYEDLVERIFGRIIPEIELLDKLAQQYMVSKSTQLKVQINDTTRSLIEKIILKLVE